MDSSRLNFCLSGSTLMPKDQTPTILSREFSLEISMAHHCPLVTYSSHSVSCSPHSVSPGLRQTQATPLNKSESLFSGLREDPPTACFTENSAAPWHCARSFNKWQLPGLTLRDPHLIILGVGLAAAAPQSSLSDCKVESWWSEHSTACPGNGSILQHPQEVPLLPEHLP